MGDSWEDWDEETVAAPAAAAAAPAPAAIFEDEDATEDEPAWKKNLPKTQEPKPRVSRYDESRGAQVLVDEGPLDDPLAEKLRQQKLVEDADFDATMELFGSTRDLASFAPRTLKEYEEFGQLVAVKHLMPLAKAASPHYKAAVKALLKVALRALSSSEAKDVETCVAGVRADKLKEEKANAGGKKAAKKASINVGRGGGSAGLDDYKFDDALDDDFDFM